MKNIERTATGAVAHRETAKARAAIDEQNPERILDLFHAGGQRGLGDPAGFRGAAEMFFAREREKEFKLLKHGCGLDAAPRPVARGVERTYCCTYLLKAGGQ